MCEQWGQASASWGLDFPEILAGTAQLFAPGSDQLTSSLLQRRIADIASFPAMKKTGCELFRGKSRICGQTITTFCLLRRQVSGGASVTVPMLLLLHLSLFVPLGRLKSTSMMCEL